MPILKRLSGLANISICSVISYLSVSVAIGQKTSKVLPYSRVDTAIFNDAAHHWYDLFDKHNIIQPKKNQPRYLSTNLEAIGDNILLYQNNNGGWPKNYDIQAILTAAQRDSLMQAKKEPNIATFDNRTTYSHINTLANIYTIVKKEAYKTAIVKGLEYVLASQYDNGGWPQYFPLQKNYSRHITYNDDVYAGIMEMLMAIVNDAPRYNFIDAITRKKLTLAYEKGISCILKTQINDAGKPTAWCQQHDEITLLPAWARAFEPPCISNGESVEVVQFLMQIKKPSKEIVTAIKNAVAWFEASKIKGIKVQTIAAPPLKTPYKTSGIDRVVVPDSAAPAIWTRYYELQTHRPMFCNRTGVIVYSLAEVDRERRDGYSWYTYAPQKVLDKYPAWLAKLGGK